MTGRRARQKQDREARIVEAAAALFQERGFEAATMQEVAARAGLAVGTLYNYFRSKSDLGLALMRRDADEGLAAGARILKKPPDDPARALTLLLRRAMAPFARHERRLWRELVGAALRDPKLGSGLFAADLRLLEQLAILVRRLQRRGALRPDVDADRAAVALYAGFLAWFLAYLSTDGISLSLVRTEVRKGIEIVVRGLLPRTKRGRTTHDHRASSRGSLPRRRSPRRLAVRQGGVAAPRQQGTRGARADTGPFAPW
jgi:AcrR family transcriptional regulator